MRNPRSKLAVMPAPTQSFPPQVAVNALEVQHPELAKRLQLYEDLRVLYEGGKELKDNVGRFLVKRERELGSAYLARESKPNYDNILSTVVSFFISKLYENGIEIEFSSPESEVIDTFYSDFIQECDRGDTSLELFFTRFTEELLVFGKSYFVIDLPKLEVAPSNLNEQKLLGGLNPYLSHIKVPNVLNWQ